MNHTNIIFSVGRIIKTATGETEHRVLWGITARV